MKVRSLAGISFGGLLVILGLAGALAGFAARTGAWSPSANLPRAFAMVAVAAALVVLAALAHALRRRDLARSERVVLAVGMVVVPFGAIAYWALGADRTRAFARRLVAMFEPDASARPAP